MKSRISGYFLRRPREMYDSPAFKVLNIHELRCLHCLEREIAVIRKGHNTDLVVTYLDFEKYGVHRRHIAPSLRALEALGFVKRTEQGRGGYEGFRRPNKWQLTYMDATPKVSNATHEWAAITTKEEAKEIAGQHRRHEKRKHRPPPYHGPKLRVVATASKGDSNAV